MCREKDHFTDSVVIDTGTHPINRTDYPPPKLSVERYERR